MWPWDENPGWYGELLAYNTWRCQGYGYQARYADPAYVARIGRLQKWYNDRMAASHR